VTVFFVLTLVPILTSGAYHNSPKLLLSPVNTDQDGEEETPEQTFVPIFAPSSVVIKPYSTAQTVLFGKDDKTKVDSQFAVLLDAETGEILAGKNMDQKFHPASMTKVMTLLVACQRLSEDDLDNKIKLTQEIYDYVHPSSPADGYYDSECYWKNVYIGDDGTVLSQLYGIAMESYADCTMMIASYIVGKSPAESEEQFVEWMNEEVQKMGLKNTHFDNIIGHEGDTYTTASDMAAILLQALECPFIAELLSVKEAKHFYIDSYFPDGSFDKQYNMYFYSTLFNINPSTSNREKAYEKDYDQFKLNHLQFQGGKTGALKVDGKWTYSLASFATNADGKKYIVVTGETTIGSSVLKDAKTLYDTYAK
jgi:D-alanyl-D-alanine carboxypeptidase